MINHQLNFSSIRLKPLAICKTRNSAQIYQEKLELVFVILGVSQLLFTFVVCFCSVVFVSLSLNEMHFFNAALCQYICQYSKINQNVLQLFSHFVNRFKYFASPFYSIMFVRNFCLFVLFFVAYTEYNIIIHLNTERVSDSIVCFTIFDCIVTFCINVSMYYV